MVLHLGLLVFFSVSQVLGFFIGFRVFLAVRVLLRVGLGLVSFFIPGFFFWK